MPRKKRCTLDSEFMRRKLREWNPHWSIQTIEGFPYDQLYAVYMKEQKKTVQSIYSHYGLTY